MSNDNTPALTETAPVARPAMPSLAPQNFRDALEFSRLLANSAFVPTCFRNKQGDILAALQFGFELGVGPMQALQNIAVINGKPSIYGDLALALVQASGLMEYIEESDDGKTATCRVKRKGDRIEHVATFSDEDAKRAGLLGKAGPWTQYPARMRMFRARGFALRDKFADVLKGLITREEAQDYRSEAPAMKVDTTTGEVIDATPPADEDQSVTLPRQKPTDKITPEQWKLLNESALRAFGQTEGRKWLGTNRASSIMTLEVYQRLLTELGDVQPPAPDDGDDEMQRSFDQAQAAKEAGAK